MARGTVLICLALIVHTGCADPARRSGPNTSLARSRPTQHRVSPDRVAASRRLPDVAHERRLLEEAKRASAARRAPAPKPAKATPVLAGAVHVDPKVIDASKPIRTGQWKVIVVHHSASDVSTPEGMHRYHLKDKGWKNGLGYHFVIGNGRNYPDGQVYAGPRWKRQQTGAHCSSKSGRYFGVARPANFFNEHGIGICLIGDFQTRAPSARQLSALDQLIRLLSGRTGISPKHVYGHGEVTGKTACPGARFRGHVSQIRSALAAAPAAMAPILALDNP